MKTIPSIRIGNHEIGQNHPAFIIAEMSGNHNGSLERALKIVDAAADSGAHALKIQTYTADTMTLDLKEGEFFVGDPDNLWTGNSLYQLYQKAYTPWEWHEPIFKRCQKRGLVGFSTPFDLTAVNYLEGLHVPLYKISSLENTDLALIRSVAATGKPLLISTGMATEAELEEMVQTARTAGCRDLVLLKCTTSYPADPGDANLATIPAMRERFGCHVGLSDHTLGTGVAIASVALGSVAIEKHITLSRAEGGVDSAFSLEPQELRFLTEECRRAWNALGRVQYGPTEKERKSLRYRRSLYIVQDLNAGDTLTPVNVRAIRPGLGLPPKHLDQVMGKKVKQNTKRGTPVQWDLLN